MSADGPSSGFWPEGEQRLEAALREAEDRELSELSARLAKVEDPTRRAELLAEAEEVKARYREKRRALRYSLFSNATDEP